MAAHNAKCRGSGVSFVSLAVESLGGWSHEAALQISRIGRLVGQRFGTTPAEAVSHFSSVCPSVCGEEMHQCGLAAFHLTQLGLMGTFFLSFVLSCFVFVTVPPLYGHIYNNPRGDRNFHPKNGKRLQLHRYCPYVNLCIALLSMEQNR